jgi:serine/threonine protein kinase
MAVSMMRAPGPFFSVALSSPLVRFVIGEVSAALLSIHELGLSFNDLKPENLLITELGHIKVSHSPLLFLDLS